MKQRRQIRIEGVVQGVGFRPFVYRLALANQLTGWVLNDSRGVLIEAEGEVSELENFVRLLQTTLPPLATITELRQAPLPLLHDELEFVIRSSENYADHNIQIAPDSYVCDDCLSELFNPADRRFHYPFINCTNCGPRYSIVTGIPYDRPKTTMHGFPMCPACRQEYDDPGSRRFHAQPNACPVCGPQLQLLSSAREPVVPPLAHAIAALQTGAILAIKGLGGYHLAVDAENDAAVAELRNRKAREEKPFALMSFNLERIRKYAEISPAEEQLLLSPERPIVLLRQVAGARISSRVATCNKDFGVMLPNTPLHYLLLEHFSALVMTSGNLSEEPIAFEDRDAHLRLSGIADYLLTHNRPIHTRTDDSISRIMADKTLLLRRSRGYVPRSLKLPFNQKQVLAVGAELKNTVCLTRKDHAFLSQHIGDLKNLETFNSFEQAIQHLKNLLEWQPEIIAHDLHPDYQSTGYAREQRGLRIIGVQHHHAHLASCMAENGVNNPCIGIIFDGIGYGDDGRIWGGEFLVGDFHGYRRVGHFAYLPMPGGDAATKEPWRMALSALVHSYGKDLPELECLRAIPENSRKITLQMIDQGINSPLTSSCGRLFDAVSALLGIRQQVNYEGQAALELEMAISDNADGSAYPYQILTGSGKLIFDPAETIRALVTDLLQKTPVDVISGRFHQTLAAMLTDICCRLRRQLKIRRVVLSGGVFQNRFLTEQAIHLLRQNDFIVLTHSLVPPNDGGIALGQAVIAGNTCC